MEFEATRGLQSERDFLKKLVNHQGNIIEACSKLKQQQGRFFLFRSKREILGARDALVMEFRKYHNFEFMKTVLPSIEDLYQRLIAVTDNHLAQISLATRPITEYSGSMPLEKKNDRFGANWSISIPLDR